MEKVNLYRVLDNIKIILFFIYIVAVYIFGGDSEKIRYSEIILIAFMVLEVIKIIKTKKIKFPIPIILIFIFAFYCFLSNFWAIESNLSITISRTLFLLGVFVLLSYNFFREITNGQEVLLKTIMWAGIVFSIYVILYYGVGEYFTKMLNGERVGKEINNVNAIGLQTSISFIIAIFYALYDNKKKYYILSIIPLIVSLGTGSRKVIILIIIGTILLFLMKREEKIDISKTMKKILLFIIFVFAFVYISKMPMFSTVFERLETATNFVTGEGKIDDSTAIRALYVNAGMEQFLESPIFGIGAGNAGYITMKANGTFTYLHNNFVELLATTGMIGFVLYYSIYVYIIWNCIKLLNKKNKYINVILILFLINLILDYGLVSYYSKNTYIYILLGLITIRKVKKNEV